MLALIIHPGLNFEQGKMWRKQTQDYIYPRFRMAQGYYFKCEKP